MGLGERKIIVMSLILIVIYIIFGQFSNLTDSSSSNINELSFKQDEISCEAGYFNIKYCPKLDDSLNSNCDPKEIKKWEKFETYLKANTDKIKNCDSLKSNKKGFDNDLACTCVQEKIWLLIENNDDKENNKDSTSSSSNNLVSKEEINTFKTTSFYSDIKDDFETFAKDNNLDVEVLYSIVITEGSYNKDFKDTIRFECHKFNEYSNKILVSCTCNNKNKCSNLGKDSFSRNPLETDYNAYLKAKEINPEFAFKSTSFGFGQILGKYLDYDLFKNDLDKLDNLDIQKKQFFNYLKNNNMIPYLQRKDWTNIAKGYNGPLYAQNNYDGKIQNNYEILIS